MQEDHPYQRFLAVVGPSGSGKSSVVKAGVLPIIREGGLMGSARWFLGQMVPGMEPFKELQNELMSIAADPPRHLLERLATDMR